MNIRIDNGNLSPLAALKIATTHWRESNRDRAVLSRLTVNLENENRRITAERVPAYLVGLLQADPTFKLPPECQALLDASAEADDVLLLGAGDAPATSPQEPPRSELHQAALEYVAKGWPVFPCISNAQGKGLPDKKRKKPACPHGYKDATKDPATIDAWWTENPEYNIGFSPESAGLAVIDRDIGGDVTPLNLPATMQSRTQSGGDHLFFSGSLPSNAHNLGLKLDTRGRGGYVLLAPSRVNDRVYTWANDLEPAPLPPEIAAKLAPKAEPSSSTVHDLDLPTNVQRARKRIEALIASGDVAMQGRGGDNRTYQLACELTRDLGLSPDAALPIMLLWNEKCQPKWEPEELRGKLEHATAYGQNEGGTYATAPASETFAGLPAGKVEEKPQDLKTETLDNDPSQDRDIQRWLKRLRGTRPIDDINLKAPEFWDDNKLFQRDPNGYVVLIYGAKGAMKTFVTLTDLIRLVLTKKVRVAYFAGEGSYAVRSVRIPSLAKAVDIPLEELSRYWVTYPAVPNLFEQAAGEAMVQLLDADFPDGVDIIVIDTLGQAAPGQDLNSPAFGTGFTSRIQFLREKYTCDLVVIHHAGKDEKKGALGSTMIIADPGTICEFRKIKGKPNLRENYVHHVRDGEGSRSIGYRLVTVAATVGNGTIPFAVPVSDLELQSAKDGSDGYTAKLTDDQRKFRHLVCEVLRDFKAYDYTARIDDHKLATELYRRTATELFPNAGERGPTEEQEQGAIDKRIDKLREYLKKRENHPAVLDGLSARELPLGGRAGQKKVRYWFFPLLLDTDDDEEEN